MHEEHERGLAQLAGDGEEVLVMSRSQLINFASHTQPAGGRYIHLLFLLRSGLMLPKDFRELVPKRDLDKLTVDPPRVIVTEFGDTLLMDALPELRRSVESGTYVIAAKSALFRVYVREGSKPPKG